MSERANTDRYTAVAVVLHWAIAAAIVANILIGWWMHEAIEESPTRLQAFNAYQLHKSIGLAVLALSLIRLGWRLANPPPPLPGAMPVWEKVAAKAAHWLFYALMIAIPLSGWLYVSTQWRDGAPFALQSTFFGLFPIPNLLGLNLSPNETRESVSETAIEAHELMVWAMLALLALHIAAALKHHLFDRDAVLTHMVPGLKPPNGEPPPPDKRRAGFLIAGAALIAFSGIGIASSFLATPAAPPAPVIAASEPQETDAPPPAQTAPEAARPAPVPWRVDPARSAITFSLAFQGAAVEGRFSSWRGEIRADPAQMEATSAIISIDSATAAIDNPDLQASLLSAEGFDAANHRRITFRLTRLDHRGGASYRARGTLTVKGRAIRVTAPVTIRFDGNRATLQGTFVIRRDEADLGMQSDPDFAFVARDVPVAVSIAAARAQ